MTGTRELPMFPLGSVLLPGMVLPLHVFEPRYRVLVDTVLLSDDREFGVVMIERGSEVGGGESRSDVGCVAEVVDVQRADDGRSVLLSVGTRRLRVQEWLEDDPFPRALVADWPDAPEDPGGDEALWADLDRAEAVTRELHHLLRRLGATEVEELPDLSADPAARGYQLATLSPLGALDRHTLLCVDGVARRAALLCELLADQLVLLRARLDLRGPPGSAEP